MQRLVVVQTCSYSHQATHESNIAHTHKAHSIHAHWHTQPEATRTHACMQHRQHPDGAAIEILNRVDGEAADREAARLRSAGSYVAAPPHG
jgi:hypothetical protein